MKMFRIIIRGNDGFNAIEVFTAESLLEAVTSAIEWAGKMTIESIISVNAVEMMK